MWWALAGVLLFLAASVARAGEGGQTPEERRALGRGLPFDPIVRWLSGQVDQAERDREWGDRWDALGRARAVLEWKWSDSAQRTAGQREQLAEVERRASTALADAANAIAEREILPLKERGGGRLAASRGRTLAEVRRGDIPALAGVVSAVGYEHLPLIDTCGPLWGAAALHTQIARHFGLGDQAEQWASTSAAAVPPPELRVTHRVEGTSCGALDKELRWSISVEDRSRGDAAVEVRVHFDTCTADQTRGETAPRRQVVQDVVYDLVPETRTRCSTEYSYVPQCVRRDEMGSCAQTSPATLETTTCGEAETGRNVRVPRTVAREVEVRLPTERWRVSASGTVTARWQGGEATRGFSYSVDETRVDRAWTVAEIARGLAHRVAGASLALQGDALRGLALGGAPPASMPAHCWTDHAAWVEAKAAQKRGATPEETWRPLALYVEDAWGLESDTVFAALSGDWRTHPLVRLKLDPP
ncbi:hypothetical protein L6R50_04395 [Myxococcota bacterium]|nr:hypothetical protein [Myxococcota bacterium]